MDIKPRKNVRVPVTERISLLASPDTTREDLEAAYRMLGAHLSMIEAEENRKDFWFSLKRNYQKSLTRKRLN